MTIPLRERHRIQTIGWLRASVSGANDGIVSTSSLLIGVAASHAPHNSVLIAGVAGLVAGAMSMATGEYVSVHSQADTEKALLDQERIELKADKKGEHQELMSIYIDRGLDPALAKQVAVDYMTHDALGAHARDELGLSKTLRARPPGCPRFRLQFRNWGRTAAGDRCLRLRDKSDSDGLCRFASVSRGLRRSLRSCRRRECSDRHHARDFLECIGHGGDGRHRGTVRTSRVSPAAIRGGDLQRRVRDLRQIGNKDAQITNNGTSGSYQVPRNSNSL